MNGRRLFVALTLAGIVAGALFMSNAGQSQSKDALFINLTAGRSNPHRVHMALEVAQMAQKMGRDVTVFFNVDGPQMVDKGLPAELGTAGGEMGIKDQIKSLAAGGATLLACPHCMEVSKIAKSDLVPGVTVSNPQALFGKLPPGAVTLSY